MFLKAWHTVPLSISLFCLETGFHCAAYISSKLWASGVWDYRSEPPYDVYHLIDVWAAITKHCPLLGHGVERIEGSVSIFIILPRELTEGKVRLLHRPLGLLRLGIPWTGDLTPRRPHPHSAWAGQGLRVTYCKGQGLSCLSHAQ